MSLTPGYGETPLPDDELAAFLPGALQILGEPVTRAAVYDLEQSIQEQVAEALLTAALEGTLQPNDLKLESPDYLVAEYRRSIMGLRDDWRLEVEPG